MEHLCYRKMALRNLFTPDLCSPLALLHTPHMILRVHELGTDIDKLDGGSANGSASRADPFHSTVI
jgi:hypothetical protein